LRLPGMSSASGKCSSTQARWNSSVRTPLRRPRAWYLAMSELKQPMRDSEQPWLEKAITEIRRQNLCFAYWCQLCPPRVVEHLRIAVAEHTGASPGRQIAESEILAITKGLAELDFSPGDQELEIPVRFILGRVLWAYQGEDYAESRLAP